MLGVEMVKDRHTKAPAKEETAAVFERMRELGWGLAHVASHASNACGTLL
jgi:4-aminobutyrate aminotransferase-like enzyme